VGADASVDVVQRRLALQPALGSVFKSNMRTEWKEEGERRKRESSEKRGGKEGGAKDRRTGEEGEIPEGKNVEEI
jgi:hypothetical protein